MTKSYIHYVLLVPMLFCLTGCTGETNNGSAVLEETEKTEEQDTFFVAVEDMPRIIGGLPAIQQRIRYPELALRAGIEGTVYVYAYVDAEGNVARTEIVRDPGAGLGEAAADAVARAQFEPGKQRGIPVPVRVSIPVHFRLAAPTARVQIRIVEGPEDLHDIIRRPAEARDKDIEGEVHLTVTLNENARVTALELIDGIGYGWDEAVMQAVARYPFYEDDRYRAVAERRFVTVKVHISTQ